MAFFFSLLFFLLFSGHITFESLNSVFELNHVLATVLHTILLG